MYSVVLMVALSSGAHSPAWGYPGCCGCYDSGYNCWGCYGGYSCWGCYGGYDYYGCYGGYNCWGCYGGYDCCGCYGGYNCWGCYGGYYSGYGCWGGYADYGCCGCYGGYVDYTYGCYGSYGGGVVGAPAYIPPSWLTTNGGTGSYGGGVLGAPSYIPPAATNGNAAPAGGTTQTAEEQQWFNELKAQGQMPQDIIDLWNRSSHKEREDYYKEHIKKGDKEDKGDKGDKSTRQFKQRGAVIVHLPAGAKLAIDDEVVTRRLASTRRFTSPPLEVGQSYSYLVKVTVTRGGHEVTTSKRVQLRAGKETEVTFDDLPAKAIARK